MDFVIAGIVIGGLLVACGVFVRDLGPRLLAGPMRRERPEFPNPKDDPAWKRYCVAVGSLITAGGLLIVLVTVLAIVMSVSDSLGSTMVLLATVVAIGCVALAAVVVTPHYRKGGFEPHQIPDSAEEVARAIPAPVRMASVDDLFSSDPPAEPNVRQVVMDEVPVVAETSESAGAIEEAIVMSPPESEVAPDEVIPLATELPRTREAEVVPDSIDDLVALSAIVDDLLPPTLGVIAPIAASQRVYERSSGTRSEPVPEPPRVAVDDDDLPAWDAPLPKPEPPKPLITSVPIRTAPPVTPGGFQSSLLADLSESPNEPEDLTGTFKSRLLNELTRAQIPAPEPTVDVLLDEFSVPPPANSDGRNPGSNR